MPHTASFILELPMKADPGDERACAIILDAGRNIGNAVLGEGLRRLDLMRESRAYRAARKMSRGEPRSPERKARANEFKRLFEGSAVSPVPGWDARRAGSLFRLSCPFRRQSWTELREGFRHRPDASCQLAWRSAGAT
jgi:hypothetical protein